MRVLVTGANGFVGRHLTRELRDNGHHPIQMAGPHEDFPEADCKADILDPGGLKEALVAHRPEACVHLAGLAFVPASTRNPARGFRLNTEGVMHVLDAFREVAPGARILVVTSSQIYGTRDTETRLTEEHVPAPESMYAVTKLAADMASRLYARQHAMHIMTARPHNHIGPGQSTDFVISAFASQLQAMTSGNADPVMRVGNLESRRDFLDVRDVARAYRLLVEQGQAGEAYNIASGNLIQIQTALDLLADAVGVRPAIEVDPALYRPTDTSTQLDCSKIQAHVGWHPQIPLKQTLRDILEDLKQPPN